MFTTEYMSPTEIAFIKTYVAALRRDFSVLHTALALMRPDGFGVEDAATATRMAVELQHMHAEFDATLVATPSCKKFFKRTPAFAPSLDALADLFALSFFKVIATIKSDDHPSATKDAGWFSGKPEEWKKMLMQIEQLPPSPAKISSPIFNTFAKFFSYLDVFKNFKPADDEPLNFWPPYKSKSYPQEIDDDDDDYNMDIGGGNPFWPLFQEYEDDDDED